MKLLDELKDRAKLYRIEGPSFEHSALLLEAAAAKIEYLESLLEVEREEFDNLKSQIMDGSTE